MSESIEVNSSGRGLRRALRQEKKKSPFYGLLRIKKRRSKRKKS